MGYIRVVGDGFVCDRSLIELFLELAWEPGVAPCRDDSELRIRVLRL